MCFADLCSGSGYTFSWILSVVVLNSDAKTRILLRTCATLREVARLERNPLNTTCGRLRRSLHLSAKCGACIYNWSSWSEPLDSLRCYKSSVIAVQFLQHACKPRESNDGHLVAVHTATLLGAVLGHAHLIVGLVTRVVISSDAHEVKFNARSEVAEHSNVILWSGWTCTSGIERVQHPPPCFVQLLPWICTRSYNAVRCCKNNNCSIQMIDYSVYQF